MDPKTGNLYTEEEMAALKASQEKADQELVQRLVPVTVTANQLEKKRVDKYDPCPCGSGKKFKFCCWGGSE